MREHPALDCSVNVVELRDLNERRGNGGHASGDEFEVADGREEGRAATGLVVPALSGFEAER